KQRGCSDDVTSGAEFYDQGVHLVRLRPIALALRVSRDATARARTAQSLRGNSCNPRQGTGTGYRLFRPNLEMCEKNQVSSLLCFCQRGFRIDTIMPLGYIANRFRSCGLGYMRVLTMLKQFRQVPACSLIACIAILAAGTTVSAQQASSFRSVIPQFSGKPGAELVLSNLTTQSAQAEVRLLSVA